MEARKHIIGNISWKLITGNNFSSAYIRPENKNNLDVLTGSPKLGDKLFTILQLSLFETFCVTGSLIPVGIVLGVIENRANFYTQRKYAPTSVKAYMTGVKSFYISFDIEIPKLRRAGNRAQTLEEVL